MPAELFDGYDPGAFFDEVFSSDGEVRPQYRQLVKRLAELAPEDLRRRERLRDEDFRSQGITFTVYGEEEGIERTFPMDLLPRVIPAEEWEVIEAGLVQRVTVLNQFLDDLYVGERAAVHDGIVPRWLVDSSDGYVREAFGVPAPNGARCVVAGVDLVRGALTVSEFLVRDPDNQVFTSSQSSAETCSRTDLQPRAAGARPEGRLGGLELPVVRDVEEARRVSRCSPTRRGSRRCRTLLSATSTWST